MLKLHISSSTVFWLVYCKLKKTTKINANNIKIQIHPQLSYPSWIPKLHQMCREVNKKIKTTQCRSPSSVQISTVLLPFWWVSKSTPDAARDYSTCISSTLHLPRCLLEKSPGTKHQSRPHERPQSTDAL